MRNDEVKWQGAIATDPLAFGFQEAWSNYRWKDASVTGYMRPAVPLTLSVWNLSQNLGGTPVLNSSFITEAVPMNRVLAVTDQPAFLMEGHIEYIHTRALLYPFKPWFDENLKMCLTQITAYQNPEGGRPIFGWAGVKAGLPEIKTSLRQCAECIHDYYSYWATRGYYELLN